MLARYDGTCVKCGQPIKVGQDIAWTRKPRLDGLRRAAWHLIPCGNLSDNPETIAMLLKRQNNRYGDSTPIPEHPPVQDNYEREHNDMPTQSGDFLEGMAQALIPHLTGKLATNLDSLNARVDETLASIEPKLEAMIAASTKTITVDNRRTGEVIEVGKQHEKFASLLTLAASSLDVYLHGEPGTGKTTASEKIAQALNLAYGYISLTIQTSESRLVGYSDAHGNFVETEFYRRYTQGGVFCIDEIDNASGNLLTALNSALANGNGAFPCGQAKRHPDFICIATGNTTGFGHNPMFPERQVLSGAIRDRFVFLEWSYDEQFELELSLAQDENKARTQKWVHWIQSTRKYTRQYDPKLPVTPRASIKGAKLLNDFPVDVVADMLVFRGYDKDSVTRILQNNPLPAISK